MRFVVADLWGGPLKPLATVSNLRVAPVATEDDRDKIGFTVDVVQRLGTKTVVDATTASAGTSNVRLIGESLADTA